MRPVDAAPPDLETVRRILREHAPELEVRAFGSRVSWTARETSDLDLALMTDEPLDAARMAVLKSAFTDSHLPFRVDVVDWAGVSDGFRKVIKSEYVTLVGKEERQGSEGTARPGLSPRHREIGRDHVGDQEGAWPLVEIGDVAEIVGGGTPSTRDAGNFDGDVPWLTPKDLSGFPARVVARGSRNLSRAGLANSSARLVPPGTVLLSTRAPIGYVAIAGGEISTNQGFRNLLPRGSVRSDFLYYWLKDNTEALERHAVGTTFRELPGSVLKRIRIPLPRLSEQRAIGQVLGALDDKIDLNRRMNETLEAMARALFKSWFVNFDPIRAKAEGRDTGLPDHIADLFPDRLVDSELGEIPEGWMPRRLEECFALIMGQSPPGNTYNDHGEGLPFFQGRTDFGFRYPENRKFCTEPTRIARSGDTLVSVRAPVGDINMAWEKCCIGRGVAALRHKSDSISFTYYSVRSLQNSIGMYEHTGTVFGAINRKQFEAIQTLEPRSEVVETFDALASPLDCCIRNNVLGIRTLATLRDALLPKLVSGEVRLGEAVERLEGAA